MEAAADPAGVALFEAERCSAREVALWRQDQQGAQSRWRLNEARGIDDALEAHWRPDELQL